MWLRFRLASAAGNTRHQNRVAKPCRVWEKNSAIHSAIAKLTNKFTQMLPWLRLYDFLLRMPSNNLLLLCGSRLVLSAPGRCVGICLYTYHFIVLNNHENKEDLKGEADLFNLTWLALLWFVALGKILRKNHTCVISNTYLADIIYIQYFLILMHSK